MMCDHDFDYAGVRFAHGKWPRPGSGAATRYYAHVYFCRKCTKTRGEPIEDRERVYHSYQKLEFGATPGTSDQCGIPIHDRP